MFSTSVKYSCPEIVCSQYMIVLARELLLHPGLLLVSLDEQMPDPFWILYICFWRVPWLHGIGWKCSQIGLLRAKENAPHVLDHTDTTEMRLKMRLKCFCNVVEVKMAK